MDAEYDDGAIRIVRFPMPLAIAVNGRSGLGIVIKPEFNISATSANDNDIN